MVCCPNLIVSCSKSGKLTTSHVKYFLDNVVKPEAKGKILYLIDHWTGHTDMCMYQERFKNDSVDMKVELIPPNTTEVLQPLDTFFHRQLKILMRKMQGHCKVFNPEGYPFMSSRNGVFIANSLAHFILKAPIFKSMIEYSWVRAGLLDKEIADYSTVNEACFSFEERTCSKDTCTRTAFIKCSWCTDVLCHIDFYTSYHLMECRESPWLGQQLSYH